MGTSPGLAARAVNDPSRLCLLVPTSNVLPVDGGPKLVIKRHDSPGASSAAASGRIRRFGRGAAGVRCSEVLLGVVRGVVFVAVRHVDGAVDVFVRLDAGADAVAGLRVGLAGAAPSCL